MEENKSSNKHSDHENHHEHNEVNITIDMKHKRSVTPTTGTALYQLGEIGEGYDLFQEVHGPGDDKFIPRDNTQIKLHNGDHFYSAQSSLNPGA